MADDLKGFELYQIRRGLGQRTIRSNLGHVRTFFNSDQDVDTYLVNKAVYCRASYLNRQIDALRLWGEYKDDDSFRNIQKLRDKRKPTMSFLTDEQLLTFLKVDEATTEDGERGKTGLKSHREHHRAMQVFWAIFAHTGMRPVEIATLTTEQVDFLNNCFHLTETKTGVSRDVPIHPNIQELVQEYVRYRSGLLFPSRNNKAKPINHHVWGRSFRKRLKLAGIQAREGLTAYSIRHTFVTRMLSEDGGNANLYLVQRIVGHSDAKTTARYFHSDLGQLQKTIKRLPIARKGLKKEEKLQALKESLLELEKYGLYKIVKLEERKDGTFNVVVGVKEDSLSY